MRKKLKRLILDVEADYIMGEIRELNKCIEAHSLTTDEEEVAKERLEEYLDQIVLIYKGE